MLDGPSAWLIVFHSSSVLGRRHPGGALSLELLSTAAVGHWVAANFGHGFFQVVVRQTK